MSLFDELDASGLSIEAKLMINASVRAVGQIASATARNLPRGEVDAGMRIFGRMIAEACRSVEASVDSKFPRERA